MAQPLDGTLNEDRHSYLLRVQYADTDFSSMVYHARYLEFLERGRSDFLRLCGFHHSAMMGDAPENARYWVVRKMELDFRAGASIDDVLRIESRVAGVSGARVMMVQQITCGGRTLIDAAVTAAIIDARARPQRLPAAWASAFAALARP